MTTARTLPTDPMPTVRTDERVTLDDLVADCDAVRRSLSEVRTAVPPRVVVPDSAVKLTDGMSTYGD